jgi:hypothetical protein
MPSDREILERLLVDVCALRAELERANRGRAPGRLLSRSDLRELGLERRAIDAVFRALPVVRLPGYARPLIREADYLELLEASSYADDRVRP